jgi:hypothetical protein
MQNKVVIPNQKFDMPDADTAILKLALHLRKTIQEIYEMQSSHVIAMLNYINFENLLDIHSKMLNLNNKK